MKSVTQSGLDFARQTSMLKRNSIFASERSESVKSASSEGNYVVDKKPKISKFKKRED